jgi:hypothetical protein
VSVAHCGACNMNLCVECYPDFHLEPDLVAKKEELKCKFMAELERKQIKGGRQFNKHT